MFKNLNIDDEDEEDEMVRKGGCRLDDQGME